MGLKLELLAGENEQMWGGQDGYLYRCSRRDICTMVSLPHPVTAAAMPDTTRHGRGLQQGHGIRKKALLNK